MQLNHNQNRNQQQYQHQRQGKDYLPLSTLPSRFFFSPFFFPFRASRLCSQYSTVHSMLFLSFRSLYTVHCALYMVHPNSVQSIYAEHNYHSKEKTFKSDGEEGDEET
jgi:hypothetical protein